MSGENPETGRPFLVRLGLRYPLLIDLVAPLIARLKPGGPLRRRLVGLAMGAAWDSVNRGDFEAAQAAYEADAGVVIFGAEGIGLAGSYSGSAGWTEFIGDIFETFGEVEFRALQIRDGGDRVVAELELAGTGRISGAPVIQVASSVYFMSRRGRVARQEVYWQQDSWDMALEAAELV